MLTLTVLLFVATVAPSVAPPKLEDEVLIQIGKTTSFEVADAKPGEAGPRVVFKGRVAVPEQLRLYVWTSSESLDLDAQVVDVQAGTTWSDQGSGGGGAPLIVLQTDRSQTLSVVVSTREPGGGDAELELRSTPLVPPAVAPILAQVEEGLGECRSAAGRGDSLLARKRLKEAWATLRDEVDATGYGETAQLANGVVQLAHQLGDQGVYGEAIERVVAFLERTHPPTSNMLLYAWENLGTSKLASGDLEGARVLLERVLHIRTRIHEAGDPELLPTLQNMAIVLDGLQDHERALELQWRVLDGYLAAGLPEHHEYVLALRAGLIEGLVAEDKLEQAIGEADFAYGVAVEMLEVSNQERQDLLIIYAYVLELCGEDLTAAGLHEDALTEYERAGLKSNPGYYRSMFEAARLLASSGELSRGVEGMQQAMVASEVAGVPDDDLFRMRAHLAEWYRRLGKPELTAGLFSNIDLHGSASFKGNSSDWRFVMRGRALSLKDLGDTAGAIEALTKLYKEERARLPQSDLGLQSTKLSLAETLIDARDLQGAWRLLDEAYRELIKAGPASRRLLANVCSTMAQVHLNSGGVDVAQELLCRAEDLLAELGRENSSDMHVVRISLASICMDRGELDRADELLNLVDEDLGRELPLWHSNRVAVRGNQALLALRRGDLERSARLQEELVESLRGHRPSSHDDLIQSRHNHAVILMGLGRKSAARVEALAALSGAEENLRQLETHLDPSRLELLSTKVWDLLGLVLSLDSSGGQDEPERDLESILVCRQATSGSLRAAALMRRFATKNDGFRARVEELSALRKQYIGLYREMNGGEPNGLKRLQQQLRDREAELVQEAAELEGPAVSTEALKPQVSELRDQMGEDSAVIVMQSFARHGRDDWTSSKGGRLEAPPTELEVVAFVVMKDSAVKRVDLGAADLLERQCSEFLELLKSESPATSGGSLSESRAPLQLNGVIARVLEPLPSRIRALFVLPSGAMASLPWEALPLAEGGLIADQYSVRYLADLSKGPVRDVEESSNTVSNEALVLGGIDFGDPKKSLAWPVGEARKGHGEVGLGLPWPMLDGTEGEARTIAECYASTFKRDCDVLIGRAATKEAFLGRVSRSRYVHVASHAFCHFDEAAGDEWGIRTHDSQGVIRARPRGLDRGLLSGLVFAGVNEMEDASQAAGILTALELSMLDLSNVQLAVLSTCVSNVGPRYHGEAITGLNRATRMAGAKYTISSLWPVGDGATALFFRHFYDALWEVGMSEHEAMRHAQEKLREERYGRGVWAAFVLYESEM